MASHAVVSSFPPSVRRKAITKREEDTARVEMRELLFFLKKTKKKRRKNTTR